MKWDMEELFRLVVICITIIITVAVAVTPYRESVKLEREKYEHAIKILDSLVAPDLGIRVTPELHADRPFNL